MNPEQPDHLHRVIADLDARLGRISDEVADMRAGIAEVGRAAGQPDPAPGPEQTQPAPGAVPGQPASSGPTAPTGPWRPPARPAASINPGAAAAPVNPGAGAPSGPWRASGGPAGAQPGWRPPEPDEQRPRRGSKITAATVIAAIGGTVMLAGIVFLLVAAIQAGLFPPIARVIAAAVLAAVLVGLGIALQSRHEARAGASGVNPGALALVGTGFAAAILDVIASSTLYHWIPVPVAYTLVGALALIGMILAQRWTSGLLACLISAATMALSPLISTGVEWPVFLVIVAVATAVLAADLGNAVRVVWSVPPAPMLMGYLSQAEVRDRGEVLALVAAALVFAAVGAAIAWYDTLRRRPAPAHAGLVVVPTAVPLLLLPIVPFLAPGWPVSLALAAAYLVAAYLTGRDAREAGAVLLSATTGSVGSAFLLSAWAELGGAQATALALTLSSIAYLVAAGFWGRRWLDWVAGIGATLAVLLYATEHRPVLALSARQSAAEFTAPDVIASIALTGLVVAATWWATRRFPGVATRALTVGAVTALLAVSVTVVGLGVVIGDVADRARDGFLAAHLVVTVMWICCAAWLVLTSRPRLARARRLGFVLGALALAKLLLLDLATLPGLFRVLAFIVVGAVMLAVAVRYRGEPPGNPRGEPPGNPRGEAAGDYRSETEPSGSGSPT